MLPFKGGEKVMNKDMIEINDQTNKGEIKMKKMKHILKNEKGLTLIELLAVIVILAIVAAIAVPSIGNIINNSKDKAILADASTVLSASKLAVTDGSCTETSGAYECSIAQIQPYVEGITLGTNDKVQKSATGVWTITFAKLANIKNETKFDVNDAALGTAFNGGPVGKGTVIEEKVLNKAMNQ